MEPADSIERIGFRRWYERQLLKGHGWFLVGLLCVLASAAGLGELRDHASLLARFAIGAGILAAGLAGFYALLRYLSMLARTLRISEHATCRVCKAYGRFGMLSATRVRCRKCGNEWLLID